MNFSRFLTCAQGRTLWSLSSLVILLASVLPNKTYAEGDEVFFRSALFDDVFSTDDFVNDPFTAPGSSGWITHLGGDGLGTRPFTELGGLVPIFTSKGACLGHGEVLPEGIDSPSDAHYPWETSSLAAATERLRSPARQTSPTAMELP